MASKTLISVLFCFFFFISSSLSAFLAPITKHLHHHSKPFYTISIYLKTPLQPTELLLDLTATFSWIDCTHNYTSATVHSIPCDSTLCHSLHSCSSATCRLSGSPPPCTANDSCAVYPQNSFTRNHTADVAVALSDYLALPVTNGLNPGPLYVFPEFVISCSETTSVLKGHARGDSGLVGLGSSEFSLPAQVNTAVSSPAQFALCMSGSPSTPGVVFFNTPGPYSFLPGIDLSKSLNYTPLLEVSDGRGTVTPYYIGVTAIKVNGKPLEFNSRILAVDPKGYGGTKINTVHPYTVLHSTIFKTFVQAFVNESAAINLTVTKPVKPFSLCFLADDVSETQLGPAVPTVDLVMHNDDVFWRMFGLNSMVRIVRDENDVWCLGFVDGGIRPRASIVIGAHQMEDNLLQFDLGMKRLGFSSSVLVHNTMCANFNFTTNNNLKPL